MGDADSSWRDVDMAFENFKDKQFVNGAKNLGGGILQLANAVQDCDVPGIGKIAQNMFTKIGDDTVASDIGEAVQLLVNGADVTVSYAAANTGAANTADASTDLSASSMAVSVSVGAVSIDMAQNAQKADRNDDNSSATGYEDVKSTNMGVTYAITDSLTLEAASVAAEGTFASNTDYKYDESAYGIAYTVASGVTLTASYSDFTQSGGGGTDVSGSGTTVELAISF